MTVAGISGPRLAGLVTHTAGSAWTPGVPFKATVALTYRCPYRCGYCGIFNREEEELSADALVGALASVPTLTWLDLTGGEIFFRQDTLELSLRLVDALPNLALFHFPTSGCAPEKTWELAEAVSSRGIKVVVSVSIEGPRELHDRVRGSAGAFDSAVRNLAGLRGIPGVSSYVGTTIIEENCEAVPHEVFEAVAPHVPGLCPADMHVNVQQGSGHYFCNADARRPDLASVNSALRRTMRFKGFPKTPFDALELAFQGLALQAARGKWELVPRCAALDASFFVSPSGLVYPCHIWAEPVGRIEGASTNLLELLKGSRAAWLRKNIRLGRCPRCWTPCEAYPTLISRALNPL